MPKPQWKVLPIHEVISLLEGLEELDIESKPPPGKKRITNIYWDPATEEIVVEVED